MAVLNAALPGNNDTTSTWPELMRETRAAVNAVAQQAGVMDITQLQLTTGQIELVVSETGDMDINSRETIRITAFGAETHTISSIVGGNDGQVKTIIFSGSVTLAKSANLKLNTTGMFVDIEGFDDDVITLMNIGGDRDALVNGYWLQINQEIRVD